MDYLNIGNHSKALVFKKFKHLCKYYRKFVKAYKKHYSVDRLLRNVNVLQVGTGENSTTLLYSGTKKVKIL